MFKIDWRFFSYYFHSFLIHFSLYWSFLSFSYWEYFYLRGWGFRLRLTRAYNLIILLIYPINLVPHECIWSGYNENQNQCNDHHGGKRRKHRNVAHSWTSFCRSYCPWYPITKRDVQSILDTQRSHLIGSLLGIDHKINVHSKSGEGRRGLVEAPGTRSLDIPHTHTEPPPQQQQTYNLTYCCMTNSSNIDSDQVNIDVIRQFQKLYR